MTQPTSGGVVIAALANCCANCVIPPAPSNGGPIYHFGGKTAMRTHWMAGTAPHKSRLYCDKSRSDNHTHTSLDLQYLPQTNTW